MHRWDGHRWRPPARFYARHVHARLEVRGRKGGLLDRKVTFQRNLLARSIFSQRRTTVLLYSQILSEQRQKEEKRNNSRRTTTWLRSWLQLFRSSSSSSFFHLLLLSIRNWFKVRACRLRLLLLPGPSWGNERRDSRSNTPCPFSRHYFNDTPVEEEGRINLRRQVRVAAERDATPADTPAFLIDWLIHTGTGSSGLHCSWPASAQLSSSSCACGPNGFRRPFSSL